MSKCPFHKEPVLVTIKKSMFCLNWIKKSIYYKETNI